jgi:hypothetical protein
LTFIDANIPMYLIGAPHPNRTLAQILVGRLIAAGERLVSDAEVLQEILHRYTAIDRRAAMAPAMEWILKTVDQVFPIEKEDVLRAAEIAQEKGALSARDAVHIAIMERYRVRTILTFDSGFDLWPGLRRIHQP